MDMANQEYYIEVPIMMHLLGKQIKKVRVNVKHYCHNRMAQDGS
jgi:hypothetical protein